jgi:enoyl-CoA hydratase/carnithine racemase
MSAQLDTPELTVEVSDLVATVEIHRPPNNFFDFDLIRQIAAAYESLDADPLCRVILLCAEGKNFCAGANFTKRQAWGDDELENQAGSLYIEAVRLFRTAKPQVAAVQGAAIGGGLGLACSADFRVACNESRFAANFSRLGFHQGFGLSVTLPRLVGEQKAAEMFYTGRRVKGDEAVAIGLADALVPLADIRAKAKEYALEIAHSAPLAIKEIRATMRGDLADKVRAATDHELEVQTRLKLTEDFGEGVKAMSERRLPNFQGK